MFVRGCSYNDICFLKDSTAGRLKMKSNSVVFSGTRNSTAPPPSPSAALFVAGVHGGITSLPPGHATSFALVLPRRMCRVETMRHWGAVMQQAYGTDHEPYHARGAATSKLGYWTECVPRQIKQKNKHKNKNKNKQTQKQN